MHNPVFYRECLCSECVIAFIREVSPPALKSSIVMKASFTCHAENALKYLFRLYAELRKQKS